MTKKERIKHHMLMFQFFAEHAIHEHRMARELEGPHPAVTVKRGKLHIDVKKLNRRGK